MELSGKKKEEMEVNLYMPQHHWKQLNEYETVMQNKVTRTSHTHGQSWTWEMQVTGDLLLPVPNVPVNHFSFPLFRWECHFPVLNLRPLLNAST